MPDLVIYDQDGNEIGRAAPGENLIKVNLHPGVRSVRSALAADPAHRHGGPGAGWYVPGPDGWQPVTDAEASEQRYPDMRHFMHDPREIICPLCGDPLASLAAAGSHFAEAHPAEHAHVEALCYGDE